VFLSELREILSLYPGLGWELLFADSALYGPYPYSGQIGPSTASETKVRTCVQV